MRRFRGLIASASLKHQFSAPKGPSVSGSARFRGLIASASLKPPPISTYAGVIAICRGFRGLIASASLKRHQKVDPGEPRRSFADSEA